MMAFLRRNAKFIVPLSETLTPEGKGIDKEDQWRQCRELLERRRDGTEDEELKKYLAGELKMAEKMEDQCRLWQVHFQLRDRQRSAIWHDECNPLKSHCYFWVDWKARPVY